MGFEYDCRPASGLLDHALTARVVDAIDAAGGIASDREVGVFWVPADDPRWPVTVGLRVTHLIVSFPEPRCAGLPRVAALLVSLRDAGFTLHEQGDEERISWSELVEPS